MMTNLLRLLSPYLDIIQSRYPKVTKNSCGYRLDAVLNNQGFAPQKIFAASEGNIRGTNFSKAKNLDIPLYRHLLLLGFEDLLSAISQVPLILPFSPVAIELLDHTVVSYRKMNAHQQLTQQSRLSIYL